MRLLDAALIAEMEHRADVFGGDFSGWCAVNGIPRATAYRHRARIRAEGAWGQRSRRPRSCPHATPDPVRALVVSTRRMLPGPDNGADQIRYELERVAAEQDWAARGWVVPSRATIHKIIRAEGLVIPAPRKRPRSSYRRFAYARPRDCYQIDATVVGNWVVFEVLDDCTRALVATLAWASEDTAGAVMALRRAFTDFGVPGIVLADNGAAFSARLSRAGTTRFTRLVTDHGARLIHSSPYHPQTCGKVERHHRTFKNWLRTQPRPTTKAQLQALCDAYHAWYNTTRRHSAWNKPPQQAWDSAPALGGPAHLPVQADATVRLSKVSSTGAIWIRSRAITVGLRHAGQRVTVIIDGDHLTVYAPNGTPLGHLTLDYQRNHQGKLRPVA
jgi:transposase InsO family protein